MKCIITATIWVQRRKSKNDPVEVTNITHNKLFFTTGSHKRNSCFNTTVCKLLSRSGITWVITACRIQAVSLWLFNTLNVTEMSCTDNLHHQKILSRRIINALHFASEYSNSETTEGTASQPQADPEPNPPQPFLWVITRMGWKVKLAKRLLLLVFCFRAGWHGLPHSQSNSKS